MGKMGVSVESVNLATVKNLLVKVFLACNINKLDRVFGAKIVLVLGVFFISFKLNLSA